MLFIIRMQFSVDFKLFPALLANFEFMPSEKKEMSQIVKWKGKIYRVYTVCPRTNDIVA